MNRADMQQLIQNSLLEIRLNPEKEEAILADVKKTLDGHASRIKGLKIAEQLEAKEHFEATSQWLARQQADYSQRQRQPHGFIKLY